MRQDRIKIALFIILALAFIARLLWIFKFSPLILTSDPFYYDQTAQSILNGEGYRNGHMFAYRPPLYPYFLALIYFIFGYNYLPVKIVQAFLSVFSCILIFLLVKRLINKKSALFATLLFAFYPQFIKFPGELWTETIFIFLFLAVLLFLYRFIETNNNMDGVIAGVLLGLAALTREVGFYFIFFIGIWLFLLKPRFFLRKFVLLFFSMLIIMMPWIIRNYMVFKCIIPVSTNGGINFYIGNNPEATGEFLWRVPKDSVWPNTRRDLNPKEMSIAEVAIHKRCFKEGIKFILTNPLKAVGLSLRKLMLLWRPPFYKIDFKGTPSEALFRIVWLIFYVSIIILAVPALFFSIRMFGSKWLILHFWIILISFIQMLTVADSRYFLPIVPDLIIFSSLTFDRIFNRKRIFKI